MGDRIDEVKGNVKKNTGELTGNKRLEAEGRAEATSAKARREAKGAAREVRGSVEEHVGALTDDESMEARGKADRLSGRVDRSG
ncbi:MAG TPA: CsbD family protein [Chloroflexota bacterium]